MRLTQRSFLLLITAGVLGLVAIVVGLVGIALSEALQLGRREGHQPTIGLRVDTPSPR